MISKGKGELVAFCSTTLNIVLNKFTAKPHVPLPNIRQIPNVNKLLYKLTTTTSSDVY